MSLISDVELSLSRAQKQGWSTSLHAFLLHQDCTYEEWQSRDPYDYCCLRAPIPLSGPVPLEHLQPGATKVFTLVFSIEFDYEEA